jgi:serine/threonine protein kinase
MPTWSNPAELVGTVLDGRYRLLRLLGSGGMGAVFEAEQTTLRKRVAIKILDPRLGQNPRHVERFLREAQAASKIRNMHVVDIADFGQVPGGSVYYVMELLDGRDLHHVLREMGRMPWPRAKSILLQMAHALEAAHDQDVVHRDVKPANCVILRDPDDPDRDFVKVVDFGIAKIFEEDAPGLTRPNEIMGTVAYMAPEQALCRPVDVRTDVYSLGVVAFELLAGRVPFVSDHAYDVLDMHCKAPPPSLVSLNPEVTPTVDAVVQRALQKDPKDRYQSMHAFEQALRSVGDDGHRLVGDRVNVGEAPTLAPGMMMGPPVPQPPVTAPQSPAATDPTSSPAQVPAPSSNPPSSNPPSSNPPSSYPPSSNPPFRPPSPSAPPHSRPSGPMRRSGPSTATIVVLWIVVIAGGFALGVWLVARWSG